MSKKQYYHRNEIVFLRDFQNRQRRNITALIDRYNFVFFNWYKIVKSMGQDEIVFFKRNDSDFVYLKTDNVHNIPLLFIDTPVGSYAFYFYIPVDSKPSATIYKYYVSERPVKNDRAYIRKCIQNDDYLELDPIYLYDKNGIVMSHEVDLQFYEFIKYIVHQRIPIETKHKKYRIQENVERYYLTRYNKII